MKANTEKLKIDTDPKEEQLTQQNRKGDQMTRDNATQIFHFANAQLKVTLAQKIKTGGFGSIYLAHEISEKDGSSPENYCKTLSEAVRGNDKNVNSNDQTELRLYAVKESHSYNQDGWDRLCREVQALTSCRHENIMPLLDWTASPDPRTSVRQSVDVYLLFPFVELSLSDDIASRGLLQDTFESFRRPYSRPDVLRLFSGICRGVLAMHRLGWSHRDVSVDNVMLKDGTTPLLTDFGSAGSLEHTIRQDGLKDERGKAFNNATLSYLAPELWPRQDYFDDEDQFLSLPLSIRPTKSDTQTDHDAHFLEFKRPRDVHIAHIIINYGPADVWSLGCVFFAILFGASPFEIQWRVSLFGDPADGTIQMIECVYDNLLDGPAYPPEGSAADRRGYGDEINDLVRSMLVLDRLGRPTCANVNKTIEALLQSNER